MGSVQAPKRITEKEEHLSNSSKSKLLKKSAKSKQCVSVLMHKSKVPTLSSSVSLSIVPSPQSQRLVCNYRGAQQKSSRKKRGVVYFNKAVEGEWRWGRRRRRPRHGPTDCLLLILNLIITSRSGSGSKWIYLPSVKSSHLHPGNHPKVQIQKMDRRREPKGGEGESVWPRVSSTTSYIMLFGS